MIRAPDPAALAAAAAARSRFAEARDLGALEVYRLDLQASIMAVSPLTRDLAAHHGVSLDEVAVMLRPVTWAPRGGELVDRPRLHGTSDRRNSIFSPVGLMRASDLQMSRRIAREGVILDLEGRYGRLGVVPDQDTLASAGWLGDSWFCTTGVTSHLLLGGEMPETVICAMQGRMIGDVVDHAVFRGRPYRVRRVSRLPDDTGVVVSFETGLIPHRMPWNALLKREMRRCL